MSDKQRKPPPSPWNWQAVAVTCVLVPAGLISDAKLIALGVPAQLALGITLASVTAIVACVVVPRSGASLLRRLARALPVFLDDPGDGGDRR